MNVDPIIILGMHRSGTSLLAGSLEAAGLFLGDVNNAAPHNKKGNKENISLRDFNDSLLARVNADWRSPPTTPIAWSASEQNKALILCQNYIDHAPAWGFKDPRSLWTLEGWLDLFPNAKLIGVFRHPALVMQSLNDRPGKLKMSPEAGEVLWNKTNQKLLALKKKHGFPLLHFDADRIEERFFNPLRRCAKTFMLPNDPADFFSRALVHQTRPNFVANRTTLELYAGLQMHRMS